MSLAAVLQSMKGSPSSPDEETRGTSATRIPAGCSPRSPSSPEKNEGGEENRESAPGLLAYVRRMADFYHYTPEETAYAIEQARADPEAWRGIVTASMERWGWTLEGCERHPYLETTS